MGMRNDAVSNTVCGITRGDCCVSNHWQFFARQRILGVCQNLFDEDGVHRQRHRIAAAGSGDDTVVVMRKALRYGKTLMARRSIPTGRVRCASDP